ncbi:MAG: polysaccharide biosynthesis/export family protein, partial [Candidatus Altiarchaeota archaeon]|nr:polysaccharide biosynthesis/export family protein [Candidatus Altiarchaeota archaeon]
MKRHETILITAVLLLAFGVLPAFAQEESKAPDQNIIEYRIGPKDLLEISVFGVNELNTTVRVSEDGKITLPLLKEVVVEGLTKSELEKKLAGLLEGKYVQNPQVTIFIREYQSKRVSVMGAVGKPGTYELLGRQTLLQILSQANGLTRDAGKEIIVMRQISDGTSVSHHIPIEDLIQRGDPKFNIMIAPNDIINVPVDATVVVYIFGQVKIPGALQVKKSSMPTLLQAVAQAGGFTDRAARGSILIKRKDAEGKDIEIKVNAKDILKGKKKDVPLEENDTVY